MGIGVSVFLLAVGAILTFAVHFHANGIDINAVGVILMVVGAIGLLASMFFWDRMGWGAGGSSYRRTVVHDVDDPMVVSRPTRRRVVRDEEVI